MRVILPPHSKFHLNGTICSWVIAKKWFSIRRPSTILNLLISEYLSRFHRLGKVCLHTKFREIRTFAAEIWRFNDFQNGGRPPLWIFEVGHFHHLTFVCVRLCIRTPKFRLNRTIWSRVIAKKMILSMASVRHLEVDSFWIFVTFPSPLSKFASAHQISSYSDDSRLRYEEITIFKMAAVLHVGFIVTSSYCTERLSLTFLTLC